jgi:hypothetical protein
LKGYRLFLSPVAGITSFPLKLLVDEKHQVNTANNGRGEKLLWAEVPNYLMDSFAVGISPAIPDQTTHYDSGVILYTGNRFFVFIHSPLPPHVSSF